MKTDSWLMNEDAYKKALKVKVKQVKSTSNPTKNSKSSNTKLLIKQLFLSIGSTKLTSKEVEDILGVGDRIRVSLSELKKERFLKTVPVDSAKYKGCSVAYKYNGNRLVQWFKSLFN